MRKGERQAIDYVTEVFNSERCLVNAFNRCLITFLFNQETPGKLQMSFTHKKSAMRFSLMKMKHAMNSYFFSLN